MFEKPFIELIHPKTNEIIQVPFGETKPYQDSIIHCYRIQLNTYTFIVIQHHVKENDWDVFVAKDLCSMAGYSDISPQEAFEDAVNRVAKEYSSIVFLAKEFLDEHDI